ncbi:MAG: ribosome-binding factor A, partial [Simkaniaceae bacterium]|nr:ribosome-binding factor A [Simkaniaceae bacterium]
MSTRRVFRLNSLLREVLSEVVTQDVSNPNISPLLTITRVEITTDLHFAKVYFSVIGT